MNISKIIIRKITKFISLKLFLFAISIVFFNFDSKAQVPLTLSDFTCFFSNLDGPHVYPCASEVSAIITLPVGVTLNTVSLTFPNTFQIIDVSPNNIAPLVGGVNPLPLLTGGNNYIATDMLTQTFQTNGATTMQVTFAYRNCNVYYPGISVNTSALYFDCDGWTGIGSTGIQYLASLVLPSPTNPGLNHSIPNVLARANITATPVATPIVIVETPAAQLPLQANNIQLTGYNGTQYIRYFDVIINSPSLEEFYLNITDELDVNEIDLSYVNTTNSSILSPPIIPNITPPFGTGTFQIDIGSIPGAFINSPPGGPIRITFAQNVELNCDDGNDGSVSASLNCNTCGISAASNTLSLKGDIRGVTEIEFTSSELQNNPPANADDPCEGTYFFDLAFNYNDDDISRLHKIIIPINTLSFSVQRIMIGNGISFSTPIPLPNSNITVTPLLSGNSLLTIEVSNFFTPGDPLWPGFTYNLNLPPNNSGAWINVTNNPLPKDFVIRIQLVSNFPNQSSCPSPSISLTPLTSNQIIFELFKTCGSNPIPVSVTPSILATPPMPVLQTPTLMVNPNISIPNLNPLMFTCEVSIPTQSPFDIDAIGPLVNFQDNQIKCTNISYRAIITGVSTPNTQGQGQGQAYLGNVTTVSVSVNNTNIPVIIPVTIGNTITIDLPTVAFTGQISNQYEILFGVTDIGCPDPVPLGSGQGNIQYKITIQAVCDDCENLPSIPSNRIANIGCTEANVSIHCDGLCTSAADTHDDLTIKRSTFGWKSQSDFLNPIGPIPDETEFINFCTNQTFPPIPDAIIQAQLRTVYPLDLLKLHVTGNIKPVAGQTHNELSFEINYPQSSQLGNNFFELIDYTAIFTPVNPSGNPITIDFSDNIHSFPLLAANINSPQQPMSSPQFRKDLTWSSTDLFSLNPSIDINSQEYDIEITLTLRVIATAPLGPYPCPMQCLFKTVTPANIPPYYRSCDIRGDVIKVLIPSVEFSQNSVNTGNINLPPFPALPNTTVGNIPILPFCEFGHAIGIRHLGGNGNFVDFGAEYRPLSAWPSALNGAGVNTISGYPGINNFVFNIPNYQNQNISQLLLPLERGEIGNAWQGLILTMDKNCPNSNPTINLDLDIMKNAYVHSGHSLTSPLINPPSTNPNLPVTGLSCANMLNFPSGSNPIIIPNGTSPYIFTLNIPPEAVGIPFSIEMATVAPGVQLNASFNGVSPSSIINDRYFFANGLQSSVGCTLTIALPGNNGCYMDQFDVTFKLIVECDENQLPSLINCFSCTVTKTFQRGTANLTNADIENHFELDGCNLKWIMELTNPLSQPTINFSQLELSFSTGMILQTGIWNTSISGLNGNFSPYFTFNPPIGPLSFGSVQTNLPIGMPVMPLTLLPGETLTYTLTFRLACGGNYLPGSLISNASLFGHNICNDPNSFSIPNFTINTTNPDPTAYITAALAPNCCIANPEVVVTHACGAGSTNGSISITNPSPGASSPIQIILFYPITCAAQPCSTVVNNLNTTPIVINNLGIGAHHLVIFDPNTGGYFEQDVIIEDHEFTVYIDPPVVGLCTGGSADFTAIPQSNTPLSSFNFQYQWLLNNVPIIPPATNALYTASIAGDYTVIVTDLNSNCSATATINLPLNPALTIDGPTTACGMATYCLPGFVPNNNGAFVHTLSLNNTNNPIVNFNNVDNCITINWDNYNNFGGTLIWSVPDGVCGTKQEIFLEVLPCCDSPNMPKLFVDNLSDIISNTSLTANVSPSGNNGYTISNITFELENLTNQFLFCDVDLVLENCNIAMEESNSFKLDNGVNITLINTNIKACSKRHNGIDAAAGNNNVTIDNFNSISGIIQDANTAIAIINGTLNSNNGSFDKNIEHIFGQRSTINISGGNYYCTGSLLPPYGSVSLPPNNSMIINSVSASSSTEWSVRLLECDPGVPGWGGALPVIKGINIDNSNTGIEVRGGGLICKGSKLFNCKRGIYHWYSINYADKFHSAECNIGTWNGTSADANDFVNCKEAIFAGGKLVPCHIDENNINNSNVGIKLQQLKGRGFTINSNILNNSHSGIYSYLNDTKGNFTGSSTIKEIYDNKLYNDPSNPVTSKGIIVEEAAIGSNTNPNIHIDVVGNWVQDYRHGITLTLCNLAWVKENRVFLNSKLDGIWHANGNLTDYINGIGINYCPKAFIIDNKVSSTETTPYDWATWLTSGFRIDMSPSTLCNNIASETGFYPNTSSLMQIGDPFEFHGNCNPTTFRLNTMNESTSRALYMGGLPLGGSVNGTIIGVQGSYSESRDNYWTNIQSGFYTDFNNVDGALNKFWMNTTYPTSSFINNSQNTVTFPNDPNYTFQSAYSPISTYPCQSSNPSPIGNIMMMDSYDDIARDSISKLGGNDTTRYFGKEFLYSQIKSDSTLSNYTVFTNFKDSVELTNLKVINEVKQKLVYPIDSLDIDSLNAMISSFTPDNNVETNYKAVFELAFKNPELKDSVYNLVDYVRLRTLAKMCPYIEGTAVYTARVLLHAFEPDSNYYNYCEFAKRPDRQSSERNSVNQNSKTFGKNSNNITAYKLMPNPNNGTFQILCPNNNEIFFYMYDGKGNKVLENKTIPSNNIVDVNLDKVSTGLYNLIINSGNSIILIKVSIINN